MALVDLLFPCPECGHDPLTGEGDEASCSDCGRSFERAEGSGGIRIRGDGLPEVTVAASVLAQRIQHRGGPVDRATDGDGNINYDAGVLVSHRTDEDPVWHRGRLLGFAERMGDPQPGVIAVTAQNVTVTWESGASESWSFFEITAVQAASSTLQLSLPEGRLLQFRFISDSPRRWEELMRHLVSSAYRTAGRGRVVEFQPRIRTA